jgi:CHAT domain-containing protein/tetratricopeptide (TPR) repeat protein
MKEFLLRQCLADQRRVLDKDDPDLIETLFWLSEILKSQGEGAEALEFAQEALEIQRRNQPDHPDVGFCLNQVATIHSVLGQYAAATACFEEAVARQRHDLGEDHLETMIAEVNLAGSYASAGNPAKAESLLQTIEERARITDHTGRPMERVYGAILFKRMSVAERSGRFADAERLLRESVESEARKKLPETNIETQRFWTWLGRARAGLGDLEGSETALDEAVRRFELARTVVGSGTARAGFEQNPHEVRALVRLERERFDDAWADIEGSRGRLIGEALDGEQYRPLSRQDVQASLSAHEAIVGWVDHELYYGGGRSWVYVVRDVGPVQWARLPRDPRETSDALSRRYAAFCDEIVMPGKFALGTEESEFPEAEARALWDERFAPAERYLKGVDRLVLIPSSAMGGVPVETFVDHDGRKAIERWTMRYAPSATLYAQLARHRSTKRPRSALLLGDPPMSAMQVVTAAPRQRGVDQAAVRGTLRGDRAVLGSLPRLQWTRSEVRSIASLFPAPRLLVGEAATEGALADLATTGELAQFDVIHLATHAFMDGARPGRSALVLSQLATDPEPLDGILTAYEIGQQWRLHADLVTLSACETALGRNILGEGTVGFAYPLLQSGARSILASLWSVNDESSELLMRRFYLNWLGPPGTTAPPRDKAVALREAQLWLREWPDPQGERPYRHPYYWSSFILIGD